MCKTLFYANHYCFKIPFHKFRESINRIRVHLVVSANVDSNKPISSLQPRWRPTLTTCASILSIPLRQTYHHHHPYLMLNSRPKKSSFYSGYLLVWIVTTVVGVGAMVHQCRRLRILLRERRLQRQQQRDQPDTFRSADTALDTGDLIVVEQHHLQDLERERADHVRLTNELKAATKMQSTIRAQLHQLKSELSTMQQQQQQQQKQQGTRSRASRNVPAGPEAGRYVD